MMNHNSVVKQNPQGSLLLLNNNIWELFFHLTFLFLFTFSFFPWIPAPFTCPLILKLCSLILRNKHVDILWMTDAMIQRPFLHYFGHLTIPSKCITIFQKERNKAEILNKKQQKLWEPILYFAGKNLKWAPQ